MLGRRGACWCVLGRFRNVLKEPLPYIPSPWAPPPTATPYSWGPFGLVKTVEMRSGTSKSLGLAEVSRLKTQPNRRISRFLRPIPRNLRDEMASQTSFWPPGAQKTLKSDELSAKIEVFVFLHGR